MFIVYLNENYKLCTHSLEQVGENIYCPPIDEKNIIVGCYINGRKYLIKEHLTDIEIYYNMEILTNVDFVQSKHFQMRGRTFLIAFALLTQVSCQVPEIDQHESLNENIKNNNIFNLVIEDSSIINIDDVVSLFSFTVDDVQNFRKIDDTVFLEISNDNFFLNNNAFFNNKTIKSFKSYKGLLKLGTGSFKNSSLNYISCNSVTTILGEVFLDCDNLIADNILLPKLSIIEGTGSFKYMTGNLTLESLINLNSTGGYCFRYFNGVINLPNLLEINSKTDLIETTLGTTLIIPKCIKLNSSEAVDTFNAYRKPNLIVNNYLLTSNNGDIDADVKSVIDFGSKVTWVE